MAKPFAREVKTGVGANETEASHRDALI